MTNYNHYRIFYQVAKNRNLTQAAAFLSTSQSNITRSIKQLENDLGCTLFVRSNRGVQLTPEGEKLYAYVRVAIEQLQAGEDELLTDKSMQNGTVSIGTSGVALRCFLLPILKEFRRRYPNIRLRISNHSTPQAITALKNGAVELALVTTPLGNTKSLKAKTVKNIRTVAVCGSAFSLLAQAPISLEELAKYPIVSLGAHTANYELYTQWFSKYQLRFNPEIEAYTSDQILPFVRNNLGIGFVPEEILEEEMSDHLYRLRLNEPIPSRSICFLKRSDQTLSIAAKELERMILAAK
jgi:DNA-binding transcriptional LysR family regulator